MTGESKVAVRDHEINELYGELDTIVSTVSGEVKILASMRPHPDEVYYLVEEQLRWRAEKSREALERHTESQRM